MKHITDSIQAYVDDELSPSKRAAVDAHCADCVACAAELRQATALWAAVDQASAPELDGPLWPALQVRRRSAGTIPSFWQRLRSLDFLPRDLANAGLASGALAAGLAVGLVAGTGGLSGSAGLKENGTAAAAVTATETTTLTLADESATLLANTGLTLTDLWVAAAADEENEL